MYIPEITVYIPSHNYGRFLTEAIESVLRQSYDNWELLIIDDGSSDNTAEVMDRYKGDHRVRLFTTAGIGLPAVCNFALKEARGNSIIRLDGDDIFDENILLVLENYLKKNKNCALVFPDYHFIDEYGNIFASERREKIYINNHILDLPANGACSLIRKNVIKKLGGYREDLGAQDGFDLWVRLKEQYKVGNVNLPLFYYRRHEHNLTNLSRHIIAARQKIKSDNVLKKIEPARPIIAVIPCRKNYDFCQNVWQEKVNGKELLEINLERCIQSRALDYIVVASDTLEVKEVIARFDDPRLRFYQRKTEQTISSLGFASTLEKIAFSYDPDWKGLTVISYVQAPFVSTETMEEAIFSVILNNVDSAFGVEEIMEPLFKRGAYGIEQINPAKGFLTDFDIVYRDSLTALAARNCNFKTGTIKGPSVINFIVSSDECFFINSKQKLKISQVIARNGE